MIINEIRSKIRWWRYYYVQRKIRNLPMVIAWRLPRKITYWAFVRVAVNDCEGNPAERPICEAMDAWGNP